MVIDQFSIMAQDDSRWDERFFEFGGDNKLFTPFFS
jgi:hypothetical protein